MAPPAAALELERAETIGVCDDNAPLRPPLFCHNEATPETKNQAERAVRVSLSPLEEIILFLSIRGSPRPPLSVCHRTALSGNAFYNGLADTCHILARTCGLAFPMRMLESSGVARRPFEQQRAKKGRAQKDSEPPGAHHEHLSL